jgi:hypothetical protein
MPGGAFDALNHWCRAGIVLRTGKERDGNKYKTGASQAGDPQGISIPRRVPGDFFAGSSTLQTGGTIRAVRRHLMHRIIVCENNVFENNRAGKRQ